MSLSSLRLRRGHLNALISTHTSTAIGKYLISPLSRRLDDGRFRASVSIRSGRGSASTDRVMRFADSFESAGDAHRYAHQQGLDWVSQWDRGLDSAVSTPLS